MAPPAKLISSEKDLPCCFTPAARVHISEFTTADQQIEEDRLRQFVHERCVEKGQPLVIGGLNALPQWNHDGFSLNNLEDLHKDKDLTFLDMKSYDLVQTTLAEYLKSQQAAKDENLSGVGSGNTATALLYGKDLTCPASYQAQLEQLLPSFLLPLGAQDCFASMPKSLRAENLMIYVGGPKTGTPLHRDLCGTYGHNLMLNNENDAYAEWYFVTHEHRERLLQVIQQPKCGLHGTSDKMEAAKSGFIESDRAWVTKSKLSIKRIPTQVVLQRPGDLILIPSLCYHQVRNSGVTTKIAWNRATPHSLYRAFSQQLPIYQSIVRPEVYRCKAMVYHVIRDWTEKFRKAKDLKLEEIRAMLRLEGGLSHFLTACRQLTFIYLEHIVGPDLIEPIPREHVDDIITCAEDKVDPFMLACDFCRGDIFNRYYYCSTCKYELCLNCYSQGRGCPHFYALSLQQSDNPSSDYLLTYADFIDVINAVLTQVEPKAQLFDERILNQLPRSKTYSAATTCRRIEIYRKNNGPFSNWLRCGHCRELHSLRWLYDTYGLSLKAVFSRRHCIDAASPLEDNIVYTCVKCSASCIACSPLVPQLRYKEEKVYYLSPGVEKRNWGGAADTDVPITTTWPRCTTDEIEAMVETEQDEETVQKCLKDYILQVFVDDVPPEKVCCPQVEGAQKMARDLDAAATSTAKKLASMGWMEVKEMLIHAANLRSVMGEDSNILASPYVDLDKVQLDMLLDALCSASIPSPKPPAQPIQPEQTEQIRHEPTEQTEKLDQAGIAVQSTQSMRHLRSLRSLLPRPPAHCHWTQQTGQARQAGLAALTDLSLRTVQQQVQPRQDIPPVEGSQRQQLPIETSVSKRQMDGKDDATDQGSYTRKTKRPNKQYIDYV
ncbi:hypothetical protein BCR43DRAFT_490087 [Syncephalastrum racemosum]|uniref:JmjC domain-containing protein n=1 Tax=Syncephalastrum racemosum TaxID=13706 RepID=A0A1X2HFE7_SYNRA|nr:hypothetical protein BCR43DRAFT_490087 [Syncephalastrum racemosum]